MTINQSILTLNPARKHCYLARNRKVRVACKSSRTAKRNNKSIFIIRNHFQFQFTDLSLSIIIIMIDCSLRGSGSPNPGLSFTWLLTGPVAGTALRGWRCSLWATKNDNIDSRNTNSHFFGGGRPGPRLHRFPSLSICRVFHEHVSLCFKTIKPFAMVR